MTKLFLGDFSLRFLVDEDLKNYAGTSRLWLRGLGFPESLNEIERTAKGTPNIESSSSGGMDIYSDGTLTSSR